MSISSIEAVAHTCKIMAWLRGFLYGARYSVSLDPDNVDRLCRHMCPCCRRTCTCVADSYVLTTSVRIANLATKVVHFVVLMGIWRIDLCYAALWLWAIGRCLVLAVVKALGPSLYGARHSVSLDPNNVDRLCRHMCLCCRRTCTCVADSYVLTTSVCIADLVTKVVLCQA